MTPLETAIVAAIIAFGAAPALALWWWMADSLNEKADLAMVRTLRAEFPSRTEVRYMRDGRPPDDIHYKIADGGAIGHLSDHEPGQPERHFKLLDCLATKPRSKARVFGKYLRRFEQDFESARPP